MKEKRKINNTYLLSNPDDNNNVTNILKEVKSLFVKELDRFCNPRMFSFYMNGKILSSLLFLQKEMVLYRKKMKRDESTQ